MRRAMCNPKKIWFPPSSVTVTEIFYYSLYYIFPYILYLSLFREYSKTP